MKPKTTLQKEIIRLGTTLPELTSAQRTYAFRHCFKHYGKRNAKGVITCTECGHAWKSGHSLADTICLNRSVGFISRKRTANFDRWEYRQ